MRTIIVALLLIISSCAEKATTPKPRGLFRIEIPRMLYVDFTSDELPYIFSISQLVTVELPPLGVSEKWINLAYTSLNAKIYCDYQMIDKDKLSILNKEYRELFSRSIKQANAISEQVYENSETNVYGTLFLVEGEAPSPIQFMFTDSISHFFRGALYYQCHLDVDSLTPVTKYLRDDIIELIQSFRWK